MSKINSPIKKVVILILFIVAAVCAVCFLQAKVTPPANVELSNLHYMSAERDIKAMSESRTMAYNDSLYLLLRDKIDLFGKEGFISNTERDDLNSAFVNQYVPIFKSLCTKRFNSPNWDDRNFSEWRSRIADVRKMTFSDGSFVLSVTGDNDLSNIVAVMDDYDKAKMIAGIRSFTTVPMAKKNISLANQYASDPYIGHSKISNALNNVKVNIGESHYRSLVLKVRRLNDYNTMTSERFQKLVNNVNEAMSEYESNRGIYGSAAKDLGNLKADAGRYVSAANQYYIAQSQPAIRVNLNSSWALTTSPNSFYKAYRSYSNRGQANSRATMFFDITGYSSFTFYIDSYAEGIYDYVMVGGLNQVPSEKSNYANTSGWQKPGTSFSYYKKVTFNNLDRSATYRIYVVYMKDGSTNVGDDRGYVLLPNIAQ